MHDGTTYVCRAKDSRGENFTVTRKKTFCWKRFAYRLAVSFIIRIINKHHNTQGKPFVVKAENREVLPPNVLPYTVYCKCMVKSCVKEGLAISLTVSDGSLDYFRFFLTNLAISILNSNHLS